jgi:hypothetical protein
LAANFANAPRLSANVRVWHDLNVMINSTTHAKSLKASNAN